MLSQKLFTYLISCFLLVSCVDRTPPTSIHPEVPEPNEPSELVLLMRQMEAHMQDVKIRVDSGLPLERSSFLNFSNMLSVQATKHVIRDSAFHALGNSWLDSYNRLMKSPPDSSSEMFNATITSCITCHQSYCPGPVMRIKKLHR